MDTGQLQIAATAQVLGSGGCTGGLRLEAQASSSVTVSNGYELPTDINQIYVICPALGLLAAPRICCIKQA